MLTALFLAVQIMVPVQSQWERSLPAAARAGDWWAVCRADGDAVSLVPIQLRLTRDPANDANPRQCGRSYKIAVAGCARERSILWVRGLPGVRRRAVPTLSSSDIGRHFTDDRGGRRVEILVAGDKIVVRDGERTQELPHERLAEESLRWVGDLDGDGILDFWLSGFDGTDAGTDSLFLSGGSPKGELVHVAASQPSTGC